jgi:putative transposase
VLDVRAGLLRGGRRDRGGAPVAPIEPARLLENVAMPIATKTFEIPDLAVDTSYAQSWFDRGMR